MDRATIDSILDKMQKPAAASDQLATVRASLPSPINKKVDIDDLDDDDDNDDDEYVPVGLQGLLGASEKLLAVNRGVDKPDERDSLIFKRFMTTDRLLSERIDMDADRTRAKIMPAIAKQKSLRSMHPFVFDNYMEGFLLGNPLSTPLEEINPLHLVEQSRRVTQMGPGGIGSDNAVTQDMQNIHSSQFGFLSLLEGPECLGKDTSVYTKEGWVDFSSVNINTLFACNINGALEYHRAFSITAIPFKGDLIKAQHKNILMRVTPNHRVYYSTTKTTDWNKYKVAYASEVYGKFIRLPCWHLPCRGDKADQALFNLPGVGEVSVEDFCSFMGWYLSEGNIGEKRPSITITQCSIANPDCFSEIELLLTRMGIKYTVRKYCKKHTKAGKNNGFNIYNHNLHKFLISYIPGERLCHEKGFPEDLLEYSISARKALLHAMMQGDGRINKTHNTYCTTSSTLALGVERLMISLGLPVRIRLEPDVREHVTTMNYAVAQFKVKEKSIWGKSYGHKNYPGKTYGSHWSREPYDDIVYCATVPGSKLYVRGSKETQAFWTGNSEKAGIDTRFSWGTRIGSNGKLYQLFKDRISGKMKWMSPSDLDGKVLGLPQ